MNEGRRSNGWRRFGSWAAHSHGVHCVQKSNEIFVCVLLPPTLETAQVQQSTAEKKGYPSIDRSHVHFTSGEKTRKVQTSRVLCIRLNPPVALDFLSSSHVSVTMTKVGSSAAAARNLTALVRLATEICIIIHDCCQLPWPENTAGCMWHTRSPLCTSKCKQVAIQPAFSSYQRQGRSIT